MVAHGTKPGRAAQSRLTIVSVVALAVALGSVVAPSAASAASVGTAASPTRALWVWNWGGNGALINFASAHAIRRLFVWTSPGFSTAQPSRYADLLRRATGARIAIDALSGDPGWVDNPGQAVAWAHEVTAFHAFSGLLPLWFNTVPAGSISLDNAVFSTVDAATLMTYRNVASGPDGISALGRAEFNDGAARGRLVRLAVETNPDPLAKVTFYRTSATYMGAQLSQVDAAYASSPLYGGIAIEDYSGYLSLPN